jgi:hypothetical protein
MHCTQQRAMQRGSQSAAAQKVVTSGGEYVVGMPLRLKGCVGAWVRGWVGNPVEAPSTREGKEREKTPEPLPSCGSIGARVFLLGHVLGSLKSGRRGVILAPIMV